MKWKLSLVSFIIILLKTILLLYWLLATYTLFQDFEGNFLWSRSIDSMLFPGYCIGFVFGFAGGYGWAFIGQLIALTLILMIFYVFNMLKKVIEK